MPPPDGVIVRPPPGRVLTLFLAGSKRLGFVRGGASEAPPYERYHPTLEKVAIFAVNSFR